MERTIERNFASAARLPDLLKDFECADVVAPVEWESFGRRAGELICRKKPATFTPTAGKYRLRALKALETAAQTRDPYAAAVLTELAQEFMQAARQVEGGAKAAEEGQAHWVARRNADADRVLGSRSVQS